MFRIDRPTATRLVAAGLLAVTLAGCKTVGPDYTRPAATTPDTFRGARRRSHRPLARRRAVVGGVP